MAFNAWDLENEIPYKCGCERGVLYKIISRDEMRDGVHSFQPP